MRESRKETVSAPRDALKKRASFRFYCRAIFPLCGEKFSK